MSPSPVWMGIANAWECDEMGHMNVRFYLAKCEDAVALFLGDCGLPPEFSAAVTHVRYHRESRAGTPLKIFVQPLEISPDGRGMTLLCRVISNPDDVLRASVIMQIGLGAGTDARAAGLVLGQIDAQSAPRGLLPAPPHPAPTLALARQAGMMQAGRLVVSPLQCDSAGFLRPFEIISIVSDGVANLLCRITPERGRDGVASGIGGAALEQRIIYRSPARAGAHVCMQSGVIAAEAKTMRFVHWLFDLRSGAAIATLEVVAVAFDLTARRAIAVDGETRARIAQIAVQLTA